VLLAHEQAFADKLPVLEACGRFVPDFEYVEVPAAEVPLEDAVRSYLFNAQLVTPPDGQMTLILPTEALATSSVANWLERHVAGNGPIRRIEVVDVRQSMANGGGPACLRLRVVADPAWVDPRFLVDERKLDAIAAVIRQHWPEQIASGELQQPRLLAEVERARAALVQLLALPELA
jgi:succinylarginine dihydrolase